MLILPQLNFSNTYRTNHRIGNYVPPPIVPYRQPAPICYRTPLPTNEKRAMTSITTRYPEKWCAYRDSNPGFGLRRAALYPTEL